jgi:hypothetical protein
VHQGHVGLPLPQQLPLLLGVTQEQVDGDGARFTGVGVEQFCQQLSGGARLSGQDKAGMVGGSPLSAPFGCGHRAEDRSPLGQQHGSGRGERHSTARSLQQRDTELPLELGDRSGQRWLGDAQAVGSTAEVQLLCHRDEVPQLASLHATRVGGSNNPIITLWVSLRY